jgi:hypothetical protein
LLRPYPQYGAVVSYNMNESHSTYHSAQFRLERRFSDGLLFTAGYTFAKIIDDISGVSVGTTIQVPNYQNYYDRRSNKSLSTFDARHRFIGNVTWKLPFGYAGRYWKAGALGQVVGGWGVNAIVQAQSGFPLNIAAANNGLQGLAYIGSSGQGLRPNLIADPRLADDSQRRQTLTWFNTAAFQAPPQFTFGNSPRTFSNLRGPAYFGVNLSLQRNFKFTETTRLQFRAEAFNLLNRTNFTAPATTLGAVNFGQLINAEDARQLQFALKLYF